MADDAQVAALRRKISEPDQTNYSDDNLKTQIDAFQGDLDAVAADIWEEKANTYSEMVDISEAGSSRKNSQLLSNAQKRAEYYARKVADASPTPGVDVATTSPIVRA